MTKVALILGYEMLGHYILSSGPKQHLLIVLPSYLLHNFQSAFILFQRQSLRLITLSSYPPDLSGRLASMSLDTFTIAASMLQRYQHT